jgi:serine-type D-Ala-D-Ala carboxypeptidase
MEKITYNPLKKKLDKLLGESLEKHVFSACSVGYFVNNENVIEGDILNYGDAGEGPEIFHVNERTIFDLASLTKPLVTSLCLLALFEEGKLKVEEKIDKYFATSLPAHKKTTLLQLLTHSSGLPAHRPFYEKLVDIPIPERMDRIIEWILCENLVFEPGEDNLYSDLGFILLGQIIEKVSGESLDEYWNRKIIKPLDLDEGLFYASKRKKGSEVYVTTGMSGRSKTKLFGKVHDDNCRALGGVAGHAGLFGSTKALLSLCENIFLQFQGSLQHPSYRSENLRKVLGDKRGNWRFGFDTPTAGLSSSGKYFSDLTIGHLGFTGTSFWIDLQRGIAIVFLSNRVVYGESLIAIKKLRPVLHDTIMEFFIKKTD